MTEGGRFREGVGGLDAAWEVFEIGGLEGEVGVLGIGRSG